MTRRIKGTTHFAGATRGPKEGDFDIAQNRIYSAPKDMLHNISASMSCLIRELFLCQRRNLVGAIVLIHLRLHNARYLGTINSLDTSDTLLSGLT
jgi:hypothetical protein